MTNKFTRRNAIAMSVAAPTLGLAAPLGGEIDSSMVGINIKIAWMTTYEDDPLSTKQRTSWHVWLPDFEAMGPREPAYLRWRPGMAAIGKWVPLQEYLGVMEDEYQLVSRA
jgi:hypothetical protein